MRRFLLAICALATLAIAHASRAADAADAQALHDAVFVAAPAKPEGSFQLAQLSLTGVGGAQGFYGGGAASLIDSIVGPTNSLGFSGGNFCGSQQPTCLEGAFATWASGTPSVPNPDGGSPATFQITRHGYTLTTGAGSNVAQTTFTENVYITSRVRWPFPNQGSLPGSPTFSTKLVALSTYIYEPNTDATPPGVTNNSTLTSPKPLCGWTSEGRTVAGNLFGGSNAPVELTCWHRNALAGEQIAGVVFTLTDQHGHSLSYTVASSSLSATGVSDQNSVIVYAMPQVDTTGVLTDGDQVTISASAYPNVGLAASVASTADSAVLRELSPHYLLKDVAHAATPVHAYVCTTSGQGSCTANGNDSTGVWTDVDATAKGLPFATFAGALNAIDAARNTAKTGSKADGLFLHIGSGGPYTIAQPTVTRNQTFACLTVDNDPAVSKANAKLTWSASASFKLNGSNGSPDGEGCIRLVNLTLTRTGSGQLSGGSASPKTQVHIVGSDIDNGSQASSFLGTNVQLYWFGGAMTNAGTGGSFASTNFETRIIRGLTADAIGMELWLVLGNKITHTGTVGTASRTADRSIVAFDQFLGFNATNDFYQLANGENITNGAVFAQTVVENISSAAARVGVGISRDAFSGSTNNIIFIDNLVTGFSSAGRSNIFYDDCNTSAGCVFTRLHKLFQHGGNIEVNAYTKGDVFVGTNAGGDLTDGPNRTGYYAFLYGLDSHGNIHQFSDAGNGSIGGDRQQAYPGRKSIYGANDAVPKMAFSHFASYAGPTNGSGTGDGAGNGNYALDGTADAIGIVPAALLKWDLAGNVRKLTGDTAGPLCNATAGSCN